MTKKIYKISAHCTGCPYIRYDDCDRKFETLNGFNCDAIPLELENPNPDE